MGKIMLNGESYGGGGIEIEYFDYALFTSASDNIVLPWLVNADYKIIVVFDIPTYISNNAVIGNNGSTAYPQLTAYGGLWYTGNGGSETYFTEALTGKHTFINNQNGKNVFDNTEVSAYTPQTSQNVNLVIGGRYTADSYRGKIYEYIIESISTGDIIEHLVPAKVKADIFNLGTGLLSLVTGDIYKCNGMSLGNDV